MRMLLFVLAALVVGCASTPPTRAPTWPFRPRHWFGEHMVLPAQTVVPVTGIGRPDTRVTVRGSWGAEAATTVDRAGRWCCDLSTPDQGGPFELVLADGDGEIVLHDVLAGDVWLCSGQSNMVMQVGPGDTSRRGVVDWQREVAAATLPQLRMFTVAKHTANQPADDVEGEWQVASPATAAKLSATAFFFGRELLRHHHQPVGLVVSAWGGTVCQAWTSSRGLAGFPQFAAQVHAVAAAGAAGQRTPQHRPNRPTVLWNAMIAPLVQFPFTGVLWYQGEANRSRAAVYAQLFPAMIADWRRGFGRALPFYFVQIAPFRWRDDHDGRTASLREAQAAALSLPDTGMVVTLDCGDPADLHPIQKQVVGERLARLALARHYGEPIACEGPHLLDVQQQGDGLRLCFDPGVRPLVLDAGACGFEVAGEDGRFIAAGACGDGDTIVVQAPGVPQPVCVRYAWSAAPGCSLKNGAGLPAAPFRAGVRAAAGNASAASR